MREQELDVRELPKPDKHPAVFRTYDGLAAGESFLLVNNHDPRHLREEFDTEHPAATAGNTSPRGQEPGGSGSESSHQPRCPASSATPRPPPVIPA